MTIPSRVGRYTITGELGRGAMGVVLRGLDPTLDRPVAVKVIGLPGTGAGPTEELTARFLRESKLAARINHPGVVTIYDSGRDEGLLYLVMELVEGESLSHKIKRGDYPTRAEALKMVAAVADALSAAHSLGVVHRDVKPANILITTDGRVKVSDFGVAKAIGDSTELTRTGMTVGSPAYMAPEQVRGERADPRADLFSLGVILYELLLHRKPFPADTVTTLVYQILNHDPFGNPEILDALGDEVAALLRRCLAKAVGERITTATEFATEARRLSQLTPPELEDTMATMSIEATRDLGERRSRFPWILAGVAVGVLAVVVLAVALIRPSPPPELPVGPAGEGTGLATLPPGDAEAPATPTPILITMVPPTPTPVAQPIATPTAPPPTLTPRPPAPTPQPTPTPPIVSIFECREGVEFHVSPDDAKVEVNGSIIGIADDWDDMGGGQKYLIRVPGEYYSRFILAEYEPAWVKIVISPNAKEQFCDVDTKLKKAPKVKKSGEEDKEKDKKKKKDDEADKQQKDKKKKQDKDEDKKKKKDGGDKS